MTVEESAFIYQKEKGVGTVACQFLFSHVGLFLIVALYSVFGAQMFIKLERGAEEERYLEKQYSALGVDQTIQYNVDKLWFYGDKEKHNWTYDQYTENVTLDLMRLEKFIVESVKNSAYDGTVYDWVWDWTFMNSLLFSLSILSTVGYGNISPTTFEGQIFCIVYAIVGIPLFLMFLANIGDSMASACCYMYSRLCCRCCRSRRYEEEVEEGVSKRVAKHVIDDDVGDEQFMPTSKIVVPISINLVILHLYFLLGGILFSYWEDWSMTSATYFTFVTLSTIGYGDYVPGNSLTDAPESMDTTFKLLACVTYIAFGMALLSMCINLMQEQIINKFRWLAQKIKLSANDGVSAPKKIDGRKDSLVPLMEQNKGRSPFRRDTLLAGISEQGEPNLLTQQKIPGNTVG